MTNRVAGPKAPLRAGLLLSGAKSTTALLDAGADPGVKNKDGHAPLHLTLNCRANARVPAVMVAPLDGAADPNATMRTPDAPIDIASWFIVTHEKSQYATDIANLLRGLKHCQGEFQGFCTNEQESLQNKARPTF